MTTKYFAKKRIFLYFLTFLLLFILAFYFCFPKKILKENIENILSKEIYKFYNKERGTPEVKVKSASLWRLSSISARGIDISWPTTKDKPALEIILDKLQVRLGIFALLRGNKNIITKLDAFGANAYGNFYIEKTGLLSFAKVDIKNLNANKFASISTLPMAGLLNIKGEARALADMRRDGEGSLNVVGKNLEIGPGNIKIPGAPYLGSINIPKLNLSQLLANFKLDKGDLIGKNINLSGGDLEVEADITINLGPSLNISKIDGNGYFKLKPEVISNNNALKMLFDIIPELRAAKAGDNKVFFSIKGLLKTMRFSLKSK